MIGGPCSMLRSAARLPPYVVAKAVAACMCRLGWAICAGDAQMLCHHAVHFVDT